MRLVAYTKLAVLFETTPEKRFQYLEHLETIKSDADDWLGNLHFTRLHHELLNTDGSNIEACDYTVRTQNANGTSSPILRRLEVEVMKYYLKNDKVKEAKSLIDWSEYVAVYILQKLNY